VRQRRIGGERRLVADRERGGRHAEERELHRLEDERGDPLARDAARAPDEVEADEREIEREEVDQPPAVPDREHAEHEAPGRVVDDEVGDRAAQAGEQERRRVRARDREERVEIALEGAAQPQRGDAHRDHAGRRRPGADEAVVEMAAVDREKEDHDPARGQQARVLAVDDVAQREAGRDHRQPGDRRARDLALRREPARVDREADQVGSGEHQRERAAPAEDARDERALGARLRLFRRRRRGGRPGRRPEARLERGEAILDTGQAFFELRRNHAPRPSLGR
jgi:hypothetical protein